MSEEHDPLDSELANLKKLNSVIESVLSALETSTNNTENVNSTVQNADKLLDLWIRVLARSNQAQKLILDEHWQGATNDLHAIEAEQSQASRQAQERQQAQIRREQEERDARERREREESERLSSSTSVGRTRGTSTRGRVASGTGRGTAKKEVVSAYAQTARPRTTDPRQTTTTTSTASARATGHANAPAAATGTGRGRGVPVVVRGTRASRGRQQGLGRSSSAEQGAFK